MAKTSITDPIWVTKIDHPDQPGKIGVSICPGKKSPSVFGGMWDRDLELDLTAIQRDFDPTAIVTLMTDDELSANKVPKLGQAVLDHGMKWFHLPIRDMRAPDESFSGVWTEIAPDILQMIKQGDNVLVHCRGGLGRSGTIAALLLIEFGLPNGLAIAQVRIARPGAIDIAEQEEYVRRYVALGQPS